MQPAGKEAMPKARSQPRPLPLVASVQEAVQQAERIAEARRSGRFRAELRKSNASVQEWVRVPTPGEPVFVSAKMGGHVWDTFDTYCRWREKGLQGGDGVRAFLALGARPALPGEADLADVEAQIGQRVRTDAKVLVLPADATGSAADGSSLSPAIARKAGRSEAVVTAKLFRSGRAQLVHLPEEFRFAGDEVRIRRHGEAVVLEPVAADWVWLDALAGELDEDFRRAVEEEPGDAPERPAVDRFFRR
jgi:antitoxin VapB